MGAPEFAHDQTSNTRHIKCNETATKFQIVLAIGLALPLAPDRPAIAKKIPRMLQQAAEHTAIAETTTATEPPNAYSFRPPTDSIACCPISSAKMATDAAKRQYVRRVEYCLTNREMRTRRCDRSILVVSIDPYGFGKTPP